MRIGRFRAGGRSRIGKFGTDGIRDITAGFTSFRDALTRPQDSVDVDGERFDIDEVTYLPPTTEENTVFCAALNYEAHAEESSTAIPDWPLLFTKLPRTTTGHQEPIAYHSSVTDEIDYEAELAAVVGTPGRHLSVEEALDYVAGYTIINDVTARDLQFGLHVGDESVFDWFSGKTMQATTPMGPHVVIDEVADPQSLRITSRLNGETMQDDSTGNMIRGVAELVSFVSSRVQLQPGDVIATGTPEGVGTFQDIRLHPDDVVEIEIEDVGSLVNTVQEFST